MQTELTPHSYTVSIAGDEVVLPLVPVSETLARG